MLMKVTLSFDNVEGDVDDDSTVVYGNERFSYDYIKKVLEFRREKNPCFKTIQLTFLASNTVVT